MTTKPDSKPDPLPDSRPDQKPDPKPDHKPDPKPDGGRPVTFAIDGVPYTTDNPRSTAADLLRLAGVDPTDHDLGLVDPRGEVSKLSDDEEVRIAPGSRFVTIFTGTTPIV